MKLTRLFSKPLAFAALLLFASSMSTPAQTPEQKPAGETSAAAKYFTDTVLTSQDQQKLRFYSDVLKGKVIVINSFFATCPGACLPLNRNLEKLQSLVGDRFGKDVFFVSISVDPTVDTPERLKSYATKLNAKPGWLFLTGPKDNVDLVLRKLGQYVDVKENHFNLFIMGNESTGLWKKAFGLAQTEELYKVLESVMNDKAETNTTK